MAFRDPHAILLNRSNILVVTGVSVALLCLSYVLGVQVGKQSAALQQPAAKGSGENLTALPAPILDQLKSFDGNDAVDAVIPPKPAPKPEPKSEGKSTATPDVKTTPNANAKPIAQAVLTAPIAATPSPGPVVKPAKWTLQLVSTPDKAEADRVSAKAKTAGYASQVMKDGLYYKVRWNHAATKPDVDAAAMKMKAAGFKPFAVPVE